MMFQMRPEAESSPLEQLAQRAFEALVVCPHMSDGHLGSALLAATMQNPDTPCLF